MRIPQDRPVYRLAAPFFDPHDNLIPADKTVVFNGIPNSDMIPLNRLAQERYDTYMDALDAGLKAWCEKQEPPVPFVPHERLTDEPEDDILDVSKDGRGMTAPVAAKLGARRRKTGHAAEVL